MDCIALMYRGEMAGPGRSIYTIWWNILVMFHLLLIFRVIFSHKHISSKKGTLNFVLNWRTWKLNLIRFCKIGFRSFENNIQNLCYKKHAFSINYRNFISKIKPILLGYDIDLNLLLNNYVEFMLTNYIKNG